MIEKEVWQLEGYAFDPHLELLMVRIGPSSHVVDIKELSPWSPPLSNEVDNASSIQTISVEFNDVEPGMDKTSEQNYDEQDIVLGKIMSLTRAI